MLLITYRAADHSGNIFGVASSHHTVLEIRVVLMCIETFYLVIYKIQIIVTIICSARYFVGKVLCFR